MIQFIFPNDSIDDGRRKINNLFFTGYTYSGFWKSLNSGSTGVSLEFSASTALISNNNSDSSSNSNNIIIGNNNSILNDGGYNFLKGTENSLKNSRFSYVDGYSNNLTGLTSSFVYGISNKIFSGTNISLIGNFNVDATTSVFLKNSSIISSINANLVGNTSLSENGYLSVYCNDTLNISGTTKYLTILNGSNNILSGYANNCYIVGSNNSIGINYSTPFAGVHENIYMFGNGITPILSASSISPLSGTYINDVCIEKSLNLNTDNILFSDLTVKEVNIDFNRYNSSIITGGLPPFLPASGQWTGNTSYLPNNNLSGLFFITYKNNSNVSAISGNSNYFKDDYGYNNKWDLPSNTLSANTVFMTYFSQINKFIKYKG